MRRVRLNRWLYGLGLLLIVGFVARDLAAAVTVNVPEIDGGTAATGLGLFTAGLLILIARHRSK